MPLLVLHAFRNQSLDAAPIAGLHNTDRIERIEPGPSGAGSYLVYGSALIFVRESPAEIARLLRLHSAAACLATTTAAPAPESGECEPEGRFTTNPKDIAPGYMLELLANGIANGRDVREFVPAVKQLASVLNRWPYVNSHD